MSPRLPGNRLCRALVFIGQVFSVVALATVASASIGPENVMVVVNDDSDGSRTLANHYVHLRQIPTRNVVLLKGVPTANRISIAQFRSNILEPIIDQIQSRQLGNQIRVVAYSSDFPLEIDIAEHQKRIDEPNLRKLSTPTASITGATFHFLHFLKDSHGYLSPTANLYARMPSERYFSNPFLGPLRDEFDAANRTAELGEHAAAAKQFGDLFQVDSNLHPLAILAAKHASLAGDPSGAIRWAERGIASGWQSAEYFHQESAFDSILQDADMKRLLDELSKNGIADAPIDYQWPVGFRGDRVWNLAGIATDSGDGINYLLSVVLAPIGPLGLSIDEAIVMLKRAGAADRTSPEGEFVFSETSDVRTTTRAPGFPIARRMLAFQGHRSRVIATTLPNSSPAIAGLMIGTPGFDFSNSKSTLVPGAIAENLTSFGAAMSQPGQTKLSELLRAGAAMSSGTVAEPYSVQFKFPHAVLYPNYAAGLSAVEAFYSSVTMPYQLLIAGDPMCSPYAPTLGVVLRAAPDPMSPSSIVVTWESKTLPNLAIYNSGVVSEKARSTPRWKHVEYFVDGRWVGQQDLDPSQAERGSSTLQLNGLPPGWHEVRVTLVDDSAIELRHSSVGWLDASDGASLNASSTSKSSTSASSLATVNVHSGVDRSVHVRADGAERIELRYFGRLVGQTSGAVGDVVITSKECGKGPIRIHPNAVIGNETIPGKPITIEF